MTTLTVDDALKLWIGDSYDKNDYENYLKMKSIGYYKIFCHKNRNQHAELFGAEMFVDLKNDLVNKEYFDAVLEVGSKYVKDNVYTRKIKCVHSSNEECDIHMTPDSLIVDSNGNSDVIMIVDWQNKLENKN